ncbi:hypothetical protein SAMN04488508_102523 [Aquimarina spongiae]|uniref:Uncharacterized protein n=1 Tax=Aquimarina spongiae TaxID=570521 RepID=A0A1M6DAW2_9FLAO|nr:hypothetical protein SAMN04488508_102523 [Aquimarina spongiae]
MKSTLSGVEVYDRMITHLTNNVHFDYAQCTASVVEVYAIKKLCRSDKAFLVF